MDENKYLAQDILSNNVGSTMIMRIDTSLDPDGKTWVIYGECEYCITMDGDHWGSLKTESKSYDNNVGNGIATVMYSIMKMVSDAEFLTALAKKVEEAEAGEKE